MLQVRRVIEIAVNGRHLPFTLYNLSSGGAAGRTILPLDLAARVVLHFENGLAMNGRIRWTRAGMVGIAFAGMLPQALIRPSERILRRRPARMDVEHVAHLVAGDEIAPCIIRNVAVMGLMIETQATLKPGQIITILSDRFDFCGQVRWAEEGRAGIRCFTPMDLRLFELEPDDGGEDEIADEGPDPQTRRAQRAKEESWLC